MYSMNMFWLCDCNNFIRIYSILVVVLQIKFVYGYNPLKGSSIIHTLMCGLGSLIGSVIQKIDLQELTSKHASHIRLVAK